MFDFIDELLFSFVNTSIKPTIIQLLSYYCNSRLWRVSLPWADLFGDVSQVVELSHVLRRADVTVRSDS